MKLSIVTVTYNAENCLYPTLQSIVKQNTSDYELIVIDGNSKDNTLQVVDSFKDKIPNIKILVEKDQGIYDAMNKGIEMSTGEYIYFLNSGDVFFNEDVLETIIPKLNEKDVFYGDSYIVQGSEVKPYRSGKFSKYRLAYSNICHQSIFYPKELLKKHKFDLRYNIVADYVTNLFIWKDHPFEYVKMPIVLYQGGGVSTLYEDKQFSKDYIHIIMKTLGLDAILYLCIRKVCKMIFRYK